MNRIGSRSQLVQRVRHQLERRGYPRLQMLLLVALTGGAGFCASFVMLHLGVDVLALRYPLAVFIAYGAFLILLWVWLRARLDELDGTVDLADVVNAAPDVGERAKHWGGVEAASSAAVAAAARGTRISKPSLSSSCPKCRCPASMQWPMPTKPPSRSPFS